MILEDLLKILTGYLDRPELIIAIGLLIILFVLVLSILWLILSFAIFGTKKKLDEIINENEKAVTQFGRLVAQNQKMNDRLSEIINENKRTAALLSKMKSDMNPIVEPQVHNNPSKIAPSESVSDDRRKHPRLEFYCVGKILGKDTVIRDISMGGLFIELDEIPELLEVGQVRNIDLDLPTENEKVRLKIKIVNQNNRGIGCKFVDLTPENQQAIEYCFHEFKDTISIRDLDE